MSVVLVAGLVGCAGTRTGGAIGASNGAPSEARGSDGGAPVVDAARSTAIPADFRTSFARIDKARFVSNGHAAGRYDVSVYANAEGQRALAAEPADVAVGARFVEEHFERGGDAHDGPVMMMEKREKGFDPDRGDWRYVVIGAAGELVKDGVIESCAGCHGDAPHDHVFRVLGEPTH